MHDTSSARAVPPTMTTVPVKVRWTKWVTPGLSQLSLHIGSINHIEDNNATANAPALTTSCATKSSAVATVSAVARPRR